MENEVIGCVSADFKQEEGRFTAFETLQKHVYFVNEYTIERSKRKFIERFIRKMPIKDLEKLFNLKIEDIELEGQYKEGAKISCEVNV